MQTADAVGAKKEESAVELQLRSVEQSVEELEKTYGELRKRMSPALREDTKDASEKGIGIAGGGCPLTIRLRQLDVRVVELRSSMVHVLERLEI